AREPCRPSWSWSFYPAPIQHRHGRDSACGRPRCDGENESASAVLQPHFFPRTGRPREGVLIAAAAAIHSQQVPRGRRKMKSVMGIAAYLSCAMLFAIPTAADPVKLRVGWTTMPGHLAPILDVLAQRHPALFLHQGKSYVAQGVRFNGGTPQIQALA